METSKAKSLRKLEGLGLSRPGLDRDSQSQEFQKVGLNTSRNLDLNLSQRGLGQDSKSWEFQKVVLNTSRYLNLFLDCS